MANRPLLTARKETCKCASHISFEIFVIFITFLIHYFKGDDMSDSSSKKQKASGGKKQGEGAKENGKENVKVKKKAKEQAAEKERKRIERERANKEKEKERRALTEKNNLLLQQMTTYLGGRGNEDSFTSDIVSECVDLTTPLTPSPDTTHQLEKTITELKSVSPHQELTIEQLCQK